MKLTVATLLALALLAAPAAADQGRALLPTGGRMPEHTPDAAGAHEAVALPDGGAVLFAWQGVRRGIVGVRMRPDGTRDPSFAAHVDLGRRGLLATGALRRPDGRLVVTGRWIAQSPSDRDELIVAQLMPDGSPDPSFGTGGMVHTGLAGNSGAALAPDGSLVVDGQDAAGHWAIVRLTTAGGIALARTVPGSHAGDDGRTGARVAADGRITVLGGRGTRTLAARLLPDGSADPTWGGGTPVRVPVHVRDFVLGDDDTVTALGLTRVVKLNADGTRDTAYGTVEVGNAMFGRLLAEPGGGVLVYRTPSPQPRPAELPALVLDRLTATGARTHVVPKIRLGGGASTRRSRRTKGLRQNGFAAGQMVVRPDGTYLLAGGVSLIQYTGEGEGTSSARNAVVALTPGLRVDRSFGPKFLKPSIAVRPLRRARHGFAFRVRVKASGQGLVSIKLRDRRGRLLAAGIAPVHKAGRSTVEIATVRRRHGRPVGYVATFRNLAGRTAGVAATP